jgi:hypothetical protein
VVERPDEASRVAAAAESAAQRSPGTVTHATQRPARPTSRRAAPPRRTPAARHVWLETRTPATPGKTAAVIALPTRMPRGIAKETASAA